MAVNTLTLYMPGSSVGIQVYEGSQLHLILVSQGANSIPSAPGETVRQDPFPQYVDDDELTAALAGVGGGATYTDAQAVDAVEAAATVAPTGAWNFTQAPTVNGEPVGSGGSGAVAAADITDSTTVGRSVLTAADAAAARTAIGAGTSSLAIGTTGTTAKAGNYTPSIADQPAGTLSYVDQNPDGTWPNRRTSRTDVKTLWTKVVAASADPASVTSPAVNGAYANDLLVGV